jgi:hypothetical protein
VNDPLAQADLSCIDKRLPFLFGDSSRGLNYSEVTKAERCLSPAVGAFTAVFVAAVSRTRLKKERFVDQGIGQTL